MTDKRPVGPNMKKFIIHKMALDAIPSGGGLADGIKFLATPGAMSEGFKKATEWCDQAIKAVRAAGEPNPWKESSEEEIAGELVRQIEAKKAAQRAKRK